MPFFKERYSLTMAIIIEISHDITEHESEMYLRLRFNNTRAIDQALLPIKVTQVTDPKRQSTYVWQPEQVPDDLGPAVVRGPVERRPLPLRVRLVHVDVGRACQNLRFCGQISDAFMDIQAFSLYQFASTG